jgi:hypothetical protein
MVRVLLVAVTLAMPVLSAAQVAGQVLFANDRVSPNTINASECDPSSTAQVTINWNPQFTNNYTSVPVGGTYLIYASNTAPANGTRCQAVSNTTMGQNILAGLVGNTIIGATSMSVSTAALVSVAGFTCANDGSTVYVCVQGVQGGSNDTVTNFAIASATVTISTSFPKAPAITRVTAGDGALIAAWAPDGYGPGTAVTQQVELEVTPIATTTDAWDAGGARIAGKYATSPVRLDGLVNGVVYDLRARAFSDAANVSDFSPASVTTGMPQAGTEPPPPEPPPPAPPPPAEPRPPAVSGGGCSSGLTGPLGLAILAGALALVRTGRRR